MLVGLRLHSLGGCVNTLPLATHHPKQRAIAHLDHHTLDRPRQRRHHLRTPPAVLVAERGLERRERHELAILHTHPPTAQHRVHVLRQFHRQLPGGMHRDVGNRQRRHLAVVRQVPIGDPAHQVERLGHFSPNCRRRRATRRPHVTCASFEASLGSLRTCVPLLYSRPHTAHLPSAVAFTGRPADWRARWLRRGAAPRCARWATSRWSPAVGRRRARRIRLLAARTTGRQGWPVWTWRLAWTWRRAVRLR